MTYLVEKTDPYAEHPELTDEIYECSERREAVDRVAELIGVDWWTVCADFLKDKEFTHVHPETGVEVTVRRT